ncbi:hypothetical protein Hanom_Chr04g00349971 [Helianthus anomalus]
MRLGNRVLIKNKLLTVTCLILYIIYYIYLFNHHFKCCDFKLLLIGDMDGISNLIFL